MSYALEQGYIRARFATAWGATTPVAWPNEDFEETPAGEWVRLTVLTGEGVVASVGTPEKLYRFPGLISIQVFVPLGDGDGRAMELADIVAGIFQSTRFGGAANHGILCGAASVKVVGRGETHYQVNVNTPYRRDSII